MALISTGRPAGGVARQRGLPGFRDARSLQQPTGVDPPGEQEAEPEPLQEEQRSGSERILPPHQALLLCSYAAFGQDLQPRQTGNDKKTTGQLQVDLQYGRAPRR